MKFWLASIAVAAVIMVGEASKGQQQRRKEAPSSLRRFIGSIPFPGPGNSGLKEKDRFDSIRKIRKPTVS